MQNISLYVWIYLIVAIIIVFSLHTVMLSILCSLITALRSSNISGLSAFDVFHRYNACIILLVADSFPIHLNSSANLKKVG